MRTLLDMESEFVVNGRDIRKWRLIEDVINKIRSQTEVSDELGLSVRQVRRLVGKAKAEGMKGFIHGLRGKPGNRRMPEQLKNQVLEIWESKYRSARLNFSHFTERLNEVEGVKISREKVRRPFASTNHLYETKIPVRDPRPNNAHLLCGS